MDPRSLDLEWAASFEYLQVKATLGTPAPKVEPFTNQLEKARNVHPN